MLLFDAHTAAASATLKISLSGDYGEAKFQIWFWSAENYGQFWGSKNRMDSNTYVYIY